MIRENITQAEKNTVTERPKGSLIALAVCSLGLIVADFHFGPIIQFPVLFVLPVMWAAWWRGAKHGIALALFFAAARFICHAYWGFPFDVTPAVVNNLLRAAGLMSVAVVLANVAALVRNLKRRNALLQARLEVCGECGVIREADGSWVPLDNGQPVPRSRTRCPSCEEKHYGSMS